MKLTKYTNLVVCQPGSEFNNKEVDVVLNENMELNTIGLKGSLSQVEISATHDMKGWKLSNSFTDLRAFNGEPGFEYKETLESLAKAASLGGYGKVCVLPNTNPVIDNKSAAGFIMEKSKKMPVKLIPMGAITVHAAGKEMAEIYDMKSSGVIAFSDGNHSIKDAGLMSRCLEYASGVDALLMVLPFDPGMAIGGMMHEGTISTSLGLKGMPEISEFSMVKRDLDLLKYHGGKLHFSCISTSESVELISQAKKEGLHVTCDVAVMNLCFTDDSLIEFDTNYKLQPPLRTAKHRETLLEGLKNGVIDAICSNHFPHDEEAKRVEFDYADFGTSTIQKTYSLLNTYTGLTDELIIEKLTSGPEKVLGTEFVPLSKGNKVVIFNPAADNVFTDANNASMSKQDPMLGKILKGITFSALSSAV